MSNLALLAVAALVAYLIGTIPVGAAWVRRLTGVQARDLNPHLLGVENVLRLTGLPAALGSFALDVLKGALPVALAASWGVGTGAVAAAAVYVG
ncbi:MAG: glycerol-3-phosphate acyltransferase, partial [bacterium]|nr:glycerol-3-phosphate acyltransferase [bacterium]